MVAAATKFSESQRNKIGFLFVVSEETTHQGMTAANDLGLKPDFMIVGEPTAGKMIRFQKGIMKAKIIVEGTSAHSGYPHLGDSAISRLLKILHEVEHVEQWPRDDVIGETHCNVGFIKGGQATNALAEYAETTLMFRVVTDPATTVMKQLQAIVDRLGEGKARIELISMNSPVDLTHVEQFLSADKWDFGTACFNTDIPYFKYEGCKAFLYGHGDICNAHSPREYIGLEELRALPETYARLVGDLLDGSQFGA